MNLIIFGAPGAGKGTLASRLAEMLGIKHISIGQVFRDASEEGTPEGKDVEKFLSVGEPVPDKIAIKVIVDYITRPEFKAGFIFDSPYNIAQTKAIDKASKIDAAINLIVTEEVVIQRLSTRRVCDECNEIYNVKTLKPKVEGVCDKCGGKLTQRDDDKPEAIKERLKHYHKRANPLVQYYEKESTLVNVEITDADAPPEVNMQKILDALKDKGLISD